MTITTFQHQCKPGAEIINSLNKKKGVVLKISKDRDKALILYEDASKEWDMYYTIEFSTTNP